MQAAKSGSVAVFIAEAHGGQPPSAMRGARTLLVLGHETEGVGADWGGLGTRVYIPVSGYAL